MSDYVNKIAPEHSRTSCDDDDLYNAAYGLDDFDGRGRCYRCTLLMAQAKARIEDAASPAAPAADAGVDGLEVTLSSGQIIEVFERHGFRIELGASFSARGQIAQLLNAVGEIERLSDAQAIIDGLRGEVDQQAQRIGELASHLEFAVTLLTAAGLAGNAQVEAMRAALSAGHEPKQCT